MVYYKLEESNDPKVIGKDDPQIFEITKGYKTNGEHSIHNLRYYYEKFPENNEIDFSCFTITKNVKLTDLMSCAYNTNGIIISKKFKELLEKFSLLDCKFYSIDIKRSNEIIKDYFWMHILENKSIVNKWIDFENSVFVDFLNGNKLDINSYEDYQEMAKQVKLTSSINYVKCKKYLLKDTINCEIDFFDSCYLAKYIISENLKSAIKDANLTGMEFTQLV
jgi:hypothetical protein